MFWRRICMRRRRQEHELLRLLRSPTQGVKAQQIVFQIQTVLNSYPWIDLNKPLRCIPSGCTPPSSASEVDVGLAITSVTDSLPLSMALSPFWDRDVQYTLVKLLLQHGAMPVWCAEASQDNARTPHYIMAVKQEAFEVAALLLDKGRCIAADNDEAFGNILTCVLRAALSVREPSCRHNGVIHDGEEETGAADLYGVEDSTDIDVSDQMKPSEFSVENQSGRSFVELSSPCMLAAASLIEESSPERIACLRPGGAPSVVHSILSIFAEQVEEEAKMKQRTLGLLSACPRSVRSARESRLKKQRCAAVSCLLRRLWALLHLALAAGSPAVSTKVETFPMPPPNAMCDMELIWSGVKNFATGWMPYWDRDVHCLYHPTFRVSAKAFVISAMGRGLGTRCPATGFERRYMMDSALVERIVGYMALEQGAWVPLVE